MDFYCLDQLIVYFFNTEVLFSYEGKSYFNRYCFSLLIDTRLLNMSEYTREVDFVRLSYI